MLKRARTIEDVAKTTPQCQTSTFKPVLRLSTEGRLIEYKAAWATSDVYRPPRMPRAMCRKQLALFTGPGATERPLLSSIRALALPVAGYPFIKPD